MAEKMAGLGAAEGAIAAAAPTEGPLTGGTILDEAVTIVSAVSESRTTPTDLIERTSDDEPSVFATGVAICFQSIALDWNLSS